MQEKTPDKPLEEATWEERFMIAWEALLVAEMRAEDAEAQLMTILSVDPKGQGK